MSTLAHAGAAIAGALEDVYDYEQQRPMREARLAEAQARQQMSQMQLAEYQQNAPNRQMQANLELQQLQNETYKQSSAILRDQTYNAFRGYEADGDVRHLNRFLEDAKRNPVGARTYGDIVRVDGIDAITTEELFPKMREAGIEDIDDLYADPELKKNFVLFTRADGTRDVARMDQMYASTGFTQYMTNEQLAQMTTRAQITNMLQGPRSAESELIRDIAKENKITLAEATKIYGESKRRQSAGSALERIAANVKANNPGMSDEEALREAKLLTTAGSETEREAGRLAKESGRTFQEEFEGVTARKERTTAQKELAAAGDVRVQLDSLAGEGGSFFDVDLTDPKQRRKAGPLITELEKLTDKSLTTEDKRLARDIRDLTALGHTAGSEIGEEEAGLIDSTILRPIKKYITNEVEGIEGTSAYEAFRNIFRNALYGASLTQSEIGAFEKAMGNLKQKEGPVLEQLNTQMKTLRNQMQSIYDLNDEYVAQYYLGTSLDDVDRAINMIDQRIEDLLAPDPDKPQYITAEKPKPAGERPSLKELRRRTLGEG